MQENVLSVEFQPYEKGTNKLPLLLKGAKQTSPFVKVSYSKDQTTKAGTLKIEVLHLSTQPLSPEVFPL